MKTPALHVGTLRPDLVLHHLHSHDPYNACVTTITATAQLVGNLCRLDDDVLLLDELTRTFRSGSTRFRNARCVRILLKTERGMRWICFKVFRNGKVHLTGPFGLDVVDFAMSELTRALNGLYLLPEDRYAWCAHR